MSYAEALKKAKKGNTLSKMNPLYIKWDKSGENIVGSFVATHAIEATDKSSGYLQYLFDTDDGPIKFALGRVADGEIAPRLVAGNVYHIVFQGKEDIGNNRNVNKFDVAELLGVDAKTAEGKE